MLAFNEPCTEREKGFIDVLLMEKLRGWYYTTPRKKIQFTPFQIQKIYWLLRNCTFWRITRVCFIGIPIDGITSLSGESEHQFWNNPRRKPRFCEEIGKNYKRISRWNWGIRAMTLSCTLRCKFLKFLKAFRPFLVSRGYKIQLGFCDNPFFLNFAMEGQCPASGSLIFKEVGIHFLAKSDRNENFRQVSIS